MTLGRISGPDQPVWAARKKLNNGARDTESVVSMSERVHVSRGICLLIAKMGIICSCGDHMTDAGINDIDGKMLQKRLSPVQRAIFVIFTS